MSSPVDTSVTKGGHFTIFNELVPVDLFFFPLLSYAAWILLFVGVI